MFEKIKKPQVLVAALILAGIFALLCLFVLVQFGVRTFRSQETPTPTAIPVGVGYCGAELTELCILSFGRDVDGNTVVNLFVPERDFPDFYLIASRMTGEYLFECLRSRNIPTSVYCVGSALNLGERVEFSVFAQEDDRLLAKGGLILKAFLISAPGMETEFGPASGDDSVTPLSTGYPNDP